MNIMHSNTDKADIAKALGLPTTNLVSFEIKFETEGTVRLHAIYHAPADVLKRMKTVGG